MKWDKCNVTLKVMFKLEEQKKKLLLGELIWIGTNPYWQVDQKLYCDGREIILNKVNKILWQLYKEVV